MHELLEQIEGAIRGRGYYLSLYVTLTLPDICGAMESEDGLATRTKYISWFDKYVAPRYKVRGIPTLSGETCYFYRCGLLHQGRAQHPKLGYSRILFVEPGVTKNVLHNNVLNDALNIDVSIFCRDVINGARQWLDEVGENPSYKKNFPLFMQRYENGLHPYIGGVAVIS